MLPRSLVLLVLAGIGVLPAQAQQVAPSATPRPIRLVVPQTAGGSTDQVARQLADRMAPVLQVPVYVENKPGAAGLIGAELVARAPADGTTLLMVTTNSHAMAPHLLPRFPFDVLEDFAPVINVGFITTALLVSPSLPVRTLGEFIAYAKARPGQLNYASAGAGSSNHIESEVFARAAGIQLTHIPYRGGPASAAGVLSGEAQVILGSIAPGLAFSRAGKMRMLVVLSDRRSPLAPEVPAATEAGFPDVIVRTWLGLVAPAGTPAAVIDRYNAVARDALQAPATREWMDQRGIEIDAGPPAAFGRLMRAEYTRWGEIIRSLKLEAH